MYTCENGVGASRKLDKPFNESTVRGLKKVHLAVVGYKRRAKEGLCVDKFNHAKRGHPLETVKL